MNKGRLGQIKRLSTEIHGLDDQLRTMQTSKELKPSSRRDTINDLRNKINEEIAASNAELEKLKHGYAFAHHTVSTEDSKLIRPRSTSEMVSSFIEEEEAATKNQKHQKIAIDAELKTLREITKTLKDKLIAATRKNAEQSAQIETLTQNNQRFIRIANEQKQRFESDLALKDGIIKDLKSEIVDSKTNLSENDTLNRTLQRTKKQIFNLKQQQFDKNEQFNNVIQELTDKLDQKDIDLEQLRERIEALKENENNVQDLRQTLFEKEADLENLEQKNMILKDQHTQRMDEIKKLRASHQADFQRESQEKDSMIEDLQREIIHNEQDYDSLRVRLRQSEQIKGKNEANMQMLEVHNAELSKQIKQKDSRLTGLNRKLFELNNKIKKYQAKDEENASVIGELKSVINEKSQSMNAIKEQSAVQINGLLLKFRESQIKNEEMMAELNENECTIQELKESLIEKDDFLSTSKAENARLSVRLSENEDLCNEKDDELKNLRNENERLSGKLDGSEVKLIAEEKRLSTMEISFTSKEQEYKERINELQTMNNGQIAVINTLQQKIHERDLLDDELTAENSALMQEINELKQQNNAFNQRLSSEIGQRDTAIRRLQSETAENEKKLNQIHKRQSAKFEQEIAELKALSKDQFDLIDDLNVKSEKEQKDLEQSQNENKNLLQQLNQSEMQRRKSENEIDEVRSSLTLQYVRDLDALKTKSQEQIRQIDEQNRETAKNLDALRKSNDILFKENEEYKANLDELKTVQSTNQSLRQQVRKLEYSLAEQVTVINEKDDELREWRQRSQSDESTLDEMRSSLLQHDAKYHKDVDDIRALNHKQVEIIHELKQKLREAEQEMIEVLTKNDALFGENEQYKEKLGEIINDHAQKIEILKNENEKLRQQNADETENELLDIRHLLSSNTEKCEKELKELRTKNKAGTAMIKKHNQSTKILKERIAFLAKNEQKWERVTNERKQRMNKMKAENERLKKTIKTMQNGKRKQDSRNQSLKRQFDSLRSTKAGKEAILEIEHLRHSIEELEKKGFEHEKKLMAENRSLKRELGKMKKENEQIRKRSTVDGKDAILEIDHLRHSIEELEKKGFEHEKRLMSENRSLKRELSKMKQENEQIRQRLAGDESKECLFKEEIVTLQRLSDDQSEFIDKIKEENNDKENRLVEENEALLSKVDALNKEIRSLKETGSKEQFHALIVKNNDENMTKKERIAAMRRKKKRLNAIIEKLNLARANITAELWKLKQNGKKCLHTKKGAYFGDRENIARWHIFGHKHCLEKSDKFLN